MSNIAIESINISKKYQLGSIGYGSLKHDLESWWARLKGQEDPNSKIGMKPKNDKKDLNEDFWALKNISFEVKQGDSVGIIGKNGAGKSTLLKILSKITSPTEGEIKFKGRIASLLEVGTGFHPDLTGRENIYLNGAILGMKKKEITNKFDEIVNFSGIEKFIDTPVKRYSSGMYVRLAFAVAAHLDSEILVLDEVLAVGDAEFQKKCLRKMDNVAKQQGRTILFVSHNLNAVLSLCNKGILIENGENKASGNIEDVVSKYTGDLLQLNGKYEKKNKRNGAKLEINRIFLIKNGNTKSSFFKNDVMEIVIEFSIAQELVGYQIAVEIFNDYSECLFCTTNLDLYDESGKTSPGSFCYKCPIELKIFREGRYFIKVSSSIPGKEILDIVEEPLVFEVFDPQSPIVKLNQGRKGLLLPIIKWEKKQIVN